MAVWAGAPLFVFDQRKYLLEILTMVAMPEVPLCFAFDASRLPALLTEPLAIVDVVVRNEHVAIFSVAVSAVATVDLYIPGLDRLHQCCG